MAGVQHRDDLYEVTTSGTNQTFTISGEGRTPIGAIFFASAGTSSTESNAVLSLGATDGLTEWYCALQSESDVSASNSDNVAGTGSVITLLDTTGAVDAQYSFNAWTTGGVVLDKDDVASASHNLTIRFYFEGSVKAGVVTTDGVRGNVVEETVGFAPRSMVVAGINGGSFDGTPTASAELSVGIVAEQTYTTGELSLSGGEAQSGTFIHQTDVTNPAQTTHYRSRVFPVGQISATAWVGTDTGAFQGSRIGFLSDGFTVQDHTDTVNVFGYLAHDPGDEDVTVVAMYYRPGFGGGGAVGSYSVTGAGTRPQSLFAVSSHNATTDSFQTGATASSLGVCLSTPYEHHTTNIVIADNFSPTRTATHHLEGFSSHKTNVAGDGGWAATFTSFDEDGWTGDYSLNPTATNRYWAWLVYGVKEPYVSEVVEISEEALVSRAFPFEESLEIGEEVGVFTSSSNYVGDVIEIRENIAIHVDGVQEAADVVEVAESAYALPGVLSFVGDVIEVGEEVWAVSSVALVGVPRGEIQGAGCLQAEVQGAGAVRGQVR